MLRDIGALIRCPWPNECHARGIEIVLAVRDYLNLNRVPHKIGIKINRLAALGRRCQGSYAQTENALITELHDEIPLIAANHRARETEPCSRSAEGTQEPVHVRRGTHTLCTGRMAQGQNKEDHRYWKHAA